MHNHHTSCPSAGYPTPPQGCGCGGGQPPPPPPPPYYPPTGQPTGQTWCGNPGQPPCPTAAQASFPGSGLAAVAAQLGGQAAELLANAAESRALCGKWHTDGVNDHKLCCTPSVGRAGIKVAACIKITRPHDPWASEAPLPVAGGTYPPSWPNPG
jgi:hypothetical protein